MRCPANSFVSDVMSQQVASCQYRDVIFPVLNVVLVNDRKGKVMFSQVFVCLSCAS